MDDNQEKFKKTTATLTEIRNDITDIRAQLSGIEQSIGDISEIRDIVSPVHGTINEVRQSISKTDEELGAVVDDLNNRSRRNNLLIKGLAEAEKEDYAITERKVRNFISAHLGLHLQENDIERAHRIGMRRTAQNHPILIKFLDFS